MQAVSIVVACTSMAIIDDLFLGFTLPLCSESEWGSTSVVLSVLE